jgi:hypothetical protein
MFPSLDVFTLVIFGPPLALATAFLLLFVAKIRRKFNWKWGIKRLSCGPRLGRTPWNWLRLPNGVRLPDWVLYYRCRCYVLTAAIIRMTPITFDGFPCHS